MFDTWITLCVVLLVSSSAIFTILNNYKLQETLETLKKAGTIKTGVSKESDTPKEDYRQLELNRTIPLYLVNKAKLDIVTETQDQMQGELNRRQELLINEHNSKGEQTQWNLPYYESEEDFEKGRVNLRVTQRYKVIKQQGGDNDELE